MGAPRSERSGLGQALVRVLVVALAGAMLAAVASPSSAGAAVDLGALSPCSGIRGFDCAALPVPLDHSGAIPGTVRLAVAVERTQGPVRGTALLLAGGPGQAALPLVSSLARMLGPALHGYRVVTFDQRGTGRSGAISCPELQRQSQGALSVPSPAAVQACAAQLGPTVGQYSTGASVDDIEAMRQALGVPRLALIGVSYGTYVAERYARKYPQNVDRLLLDSVVPQEGVDPLLSSTFAGVPAVLASLCGQGGCARFLRDPMSAVNDLVSVLRHRPIRGRVGAMGGGQKMVTLPSREDLLNLLVSASQFPELLSRVPAALASAVRGDDATLLRVFDLIRSAPPAQALSSGVNAATLCADVRAPWGGADVPLAARPPALAAAAGAVPASTLSPFGAAVAAGNGLVQTCLNWPPTSVPPAPPPGLLPDVPTLFLNGERDLSTPAPDAAHEATRSPRGVLVVVPGQGHAILGTPPPCVLQAVDRLFAGANIGDPCRATKPPFSTAAQDPHSLSRVAPPRPLRGRRGRMLRAALGAITDAVFVTQVVPQVSSVVLNHITYGGLRGGRFRVVPTPGGGLRFAFARDTYVPGVPVSGHLRLDRNLALLPGRLTVGGRSGGFLVIHGNGSVSGRLGHRAVRVSLTVA